MTVHLIIPDTHAHPDHSNERFEWLGKLIVDLKPDKVIHLGDIGDMPSLCSYEERTRAFEGRRYRKDVDCVIDAQERLFAPIKAAKKRRPKFYLLEGNHEHRVERAILTNPTHLEGTISIKDFKFYQFGWNYIPYSGASPGVVEVDGISYAHYFTSGIMNRPISGVHPAYHLIHKQYTSCTQGHVHTTDYCVRTAANGRMLHGLIAGVYVDYFMDWAGEANNLWWKGVIVKRNVHDGMYDPEWIGIERIKKEYG